MMDRAESPIVTQHRPSGRDVAEVVVHVAWARDGDDVHALARVLTDAERQRAARFRVAADRRRFVVGRAMVRMLCAARLDVDPGSLAISPAEDGKPRVAAPGGESTNVNVSHSAECVLVALASGVEVGVDVERIRTVPDRASLSRRLFHPSEHEALMRLPERERDAAFLTIWVRKEAFLKCRGVGLNEDLAEPALLPADIGGSFRVSRAGEHWCIRDVGLGPSYTAAVAAASHDLACTLEPWVAPAWVRSWTSVPTATA